MPLYGPQFQIQISDPVEICVHANQKLGWDQLCQGYLSTPAPPGSWPDAGMQPDTGWNENKWMDQSYLNHMDESYIHTKEKTNEHMSRDRSFTSESQVLSRGIFWIYKYLGEDLEPQKF